ncbi:hypothetical protein D3C81_962730 [compost metagenome]
MYIASRHQVDWKAIVDVEHSVGMRLEPARCHALLAQALGLGLVGSRYQQVAMRFTEYLPFIAAQVQEEQAHGVMARSHLAQFDAIAIDPGDFQPGVDVQAFGAAEPGFAQLGMELFQRVRLGEDHIVDFDTGSRVATAEHDDVEHDQSFRAAKSAAV